MRLFAIPASTLVVRLLSYHDVVMTNGIIKIFSNGPGRVFKTDELVRFQV